MSQAQAQAPAQPQAPSQGLLSQEQFRKALPNRVRKNVNQEVIDKVNQLLADPDMHEVYRENLLSYGQVMADGRFKVSNYVDAVKYVSHKLMGKTNFDAFSATFPDKIQRWTQQGVASKDMASYVTAYHKSKLVNLIMEQSLVPTWIINQDLYQKALNTQAELMVSARSEKVRSDAANSILTHLKRPETQKVELDIGVKEDSSIAALRETTQEYVAAQRRAIESGMFNAQEVAHQPLVIQGDSEEGDDHE